MNKNAVFFGVTRFSIYTPRNGAWNISSALDSDYIVNLFSDERLEPRFNIFIKYALPIYERYYRDYTYRHILLYSDLMPEKWKVILFEAEKKYPFLELCKVHDQIEFMHVMENFLRKERCVDCPVALFRVDDDDLLSVDYIEQLSKYTDIPFKGMSVSFGRGIAAKFTVNKFSDFKIVRKPLLALGLASIGHYEVKSQKLSLPGAVNHTETDLHRPVILDSRKPAFVWTHHKLQDSNHMDKKSSILSKGEIDFLSFKSIEDRLLISKFPTVLSDYDEVGVELISTFTDCNENNSFKFENSNISESGNYRIKFEFLFSSNAVYNPKGLIIYLGSGAKNLTCIPGMTLSKNNGIGWYRYLSTTAGSVIGYIDIYISECTEIDSLFVKNWGVNCLFSVVQLKVEKIG